MPRRALIAGAALLALAACGKGGVAENAAAPAGSTVEVAPGDEPVEMESGTPMSTIDAATGEARGMPSDYSGPTAYDLGQRADRKDPKPKADEEARTEAAEAPIASIADAPGGD